MTLTTLAFVLLGSSIVACSARRWSSPKYSCLKQPMKSLWASVLATGTFAMHPACAEKHTGAAWDSEDPLEISSPTRLAQSTLDIPASVTIITEAQIRSLGLYRFQDLLRLVPGMAVVQPNGGDLRANYHGTNILVPRRMNVLVDGIVIQRSNYAQIDWPQLPITIDDIERIEVTRGPNAASYGPNSFLATINIISKSPQHVERAWGSVGLNTRGGHQATARWGHQMGTTALRLTASSEMDPGYDFDTRSRSNHDSVRVQRLNLRTRTDLSDQSRFELQGFLVRSHKEVPAVDDAQTSYPDTRTHDAYVDALWTHALSPSHELQWRANYAQSDSQQSWTTCLPQAMFLPELATLWQANPAYAQQVLSGQTPQGGTSSDDALATQAASAIAALGDAAKSVVCVTPNQDLRQSRTDLELQDTWVVSDQLRWLNGVGLRRQAARSQTYLDGRQSNTLYRAFTHLEYRWRPWAHINLGGFYEHDPKSTSTFSPRAALNVHLTERQSLRAVASKAVRTPDLYEQSANFSYLVESPVPINGQTSVRFYQSARSPGNLGPERIDSHELGYMAIPGYGSQFDLKVFHDRLRSLISEKLQLKSFEPTNNNAVTLRGAEMQIAQQWNARWSSFLNYAYLDNVDASMATERTQYSRHSGSIGLSRRSDTGWRWSMAYYGASGDGLGESPYGREDLTLTKYLTLSASASSSISLVLSHWDHKSSTYFRDFAGKHAAPASSFNKSTQLTARVGLSF